MLERLALTGRAKALVYRGHHELVLEHAAVGALAQEAVLVVSVDVTAMREQVP